MSVETAFAIKMFAAITCRAVAKGGEGGVSPSNKFQKQGAIAKSRAPSGALKTSIIF